VTSFKRFRVLTSGQIRQGKQNALLLELFIGNVPNTTTKTNKLLSYGDDGDSADPSKKKKKLFTGILIGEASQQR